MFKKKKPHRLTFLVCFKVIRVYNKNSEKNQKYETFVYVF